MKKKLALITLSLLSFGVNAKVLNENNPKDYQQFRLSLAEITEIVNPKTLPYRDFYLKPSTGANKIWFDAVKQGDLETVQTMVQNGQDIEAKDDGSLDQTALGWAAFIGYNDMVNYLISQNANLWATDTGDVYNVLKSSVLGKNTEVVKNIYNIMKDQVDINDQSLESDGETLVMVAASNNRIETVKYLISIGADLNKSTTTNDKTEGSYDQSALTYACKRDHKEMQKLLIENGALNHRTHKPACD